MRITLGASADGYILDIRANLDRYLEGTSQANGRRPNARYTSFDYCFNYFRSYYETGNLVGLIRPENVQASCMQLGFYLASWGMLRGSARLLQKSARHFIPVVEAIRTAEPSIWDIDVDSYSDSHIEALLDLAARLRRSNEGMSDILVTKVMLGVFGSVPAFDTNFRRGFSVTRFNAKSLRKIGAFYTDNAQLLDEYRVHTLDFVTGQPTRRRYTRAKVIDMVFFVEGMR